MTHAERTALMNRQARLAPRLSGQGSHLDQIRKLSTAAVRSAAERDPSDALLEAELAARAVIEKIRAATDDETHAPAKGGTA